jgi:hypothetical protein
MESPGVWKRKIGSTKNVKNPHKFLDPKSDITFMEGPKISPFLHGFSMISFYFLRDLKK